MSTPDAKPTRPSSDAPCPCGSGRSFGQCCEPILNQRRTAATAEELMRSRFTAHAVGDYQHLHRTYLGTVRKPYIEEQAEGPAPKWSRLEIHAHEPGPRPDLAHVDFTAYYRHEGVEHPMPEKAEFQRIDGAWLYTRALREGPAPAKAAPKAGRNDPCPCGSGKKYKHCCGK